ncbi:hypothetical protein [Actinacidiphila acidipaludis]|uniref:Uncharacterized protein n=1 Tax=Actinacidiphila acidipaludis TaxID=2873382 RepID=A0ABS7Q2M7_9ACTN|nr:hypothetical protein [Streptomyces acidipaludis]MBY8877385.1 hypothetical protein [Streptomyces acidipaludis]
MLGFMDWSVVVLGCVLILLSAGLFWWQRAKTRKRASPGQVMRHSSAWPPLLMGFGMLTAKVPHLLGASFTVVDIADSASFVLAAAVGLLFLLQAGRRAAPEPCGTDQD